MKYLKEYNNAEYYYELSPEEYLRYYSKYIPFESGENKEIAKLIKGDYLVFDYDQTILHITLSDAGDFGSNKSGRQTAYYTHPIVVRRGGKDKNKEMIIDKLRDDWYLISIVTGFDEKEYYRCDRLDGLVKCLEDNF